MFNISPRRTRKNGFKLTSTFRLARVKKCPPNLTPPISFYQTPRIALNLITGATYKRSASPYKIASSVAHPQSPKTGGGLQPNWVARAPRERFRVSTKILCQPCGPSRMSRVSAATSLYSFALASLLLLLLLPPLALTAAEISEDALLLSPRSLSIASSGVGITSSSLIVLFGWGVGRSIAA